jgi:hypothetical protein
MGVMIDSTEHAKQASSATRPLHLRLGMHEWVWLLPLAEFGMCDVDQRACIAAVETGLLHA